MYEIVPRKLVSEPRPLSGWWDDLLSALTPGPELPASGPGPTLPGQKPDWWYSQVQYQAQAPFLERARAKYSMMEALGRVVSPELEFSWVESGVKIAPENLASVAKMFSQVPVHEGSFRHLFQMSKPTKCHSVAVPILSEKPLFKIGLDPSGHPLGPNGISPLGSFFDWMLYLSREKGKPINLAKFDKPNNPIKFFEENVIPEHGTIVLGLGATEESSGKWRPNDYASWQDVSVGSPYWKMAVVNDFCGVQEFQATLRDEWMLYGVDWKYVNPNLIFVKGPRDQWPEEALAVQHFNLPADRSPSPFNPGTVPTDVVTSSFDRRETIESNTSTSRTSWSFDSRWAWGGVAAVALLGVAWYALSDSGGTATPNRAKRRRLPRRR